MKSFIVTALLLTAQIGFAQIAHSENEPSHQKAIVQAITEKCGYMVQMDLFAQTESAPTKDIGATEIKYHSEIQGRMVYDQTLSDLVTVTVDSVYQELAANGSTTAGFYKVTSVTCGE